MVVSQGEIWWAELPEPSGSEPGFRRPVLIVQGDSLNSSRIATVVCVPLTSNLRWAEAPGNVLLRGKNTGLPGAGHTALCWASWPSRYDHLANAPLAREGLPGAEGRAAARDG